MDKEAPLLRGGIRFLRQQNRSAARRPIALAGQHA